jgi:L-fuconolactonase
MNLNRRTFIKITGAGVVSAVWDSASVCWAAAPKEQAIKSPSHTIIDTHTHFYDPPRPQGVPWPDKNDKVLYRKVMPRDYQALPQPRPVTGTVVVEASSWLEDNQWILDLAAQHPFIVGFVGNLPVGAGSFSEHLERFARNRLFRGIRVRSDQLKRGLGEARFMSDLKLLPKSGLSLDIVGSPPMLADVSRLAREIPTLPLVIDHLAGVKIDGRAPDPEWQHGMRQAAKSTNVYCKVSGLVEGTGRSDGAAPRDVAFYRPALDVVWDAFGEDRCIYGSNWPVSELFADCATVQRIVLDYFQTKGQAALEKCFWKNSLAVYRWIQRTA